MAPYTKLYSIAHSRETADQAATLVDERDVLVHAV